ncbi:MAG: flavodoxin family protein [Deltaproteobacteria bacterium]|jgi:multimeric flavodoxin WrbA|nr:flavodoxin family protein [Deltaproteobacteria bacterium]
MNIAVILGSPRLSSNSALLAEEAVKASGAGEGEVKKFFLNSLSIKGCQACYSCKSKTEFCVVKDDLTPVLAAAANADLVILTAPIYIGDVTAQAKLFIDRTFAWFKPDFKSNKVPGRLAGGGRRMLLIFTQGNPDSSVYAKNSQHYEAYFQAQGFKTAVLTGESLLGDNVLDTRPDLVKKVRDLAAELLKN